MSHWKPSTATITVANADCQSSGPFSAAASTTGGWHFYALWADTAIGRHRLNAGTHLAKYEPAVMGEVAD